MFADARQVGIGSFSCVFGDVEARPTDLAGFESRWQAVSPGTDFSTMGCQTYRRMSAPVAGYVVDAITTTLASASVPAADVDHLVIATSESTSESLPLNFAIRVLAGAGLVNCVPHVLSYQRCCSSLTALRFARLLFAEPGTLRVLVASVDATPDDHDRLQSYAVFGDAAVSCLLTADDDHALVRLVSAAIHVDHDGLLGHDTFASRQSVSTRALSAVLDHSDGGLDRIAQVFGPNLHRPLSLFNATAAGIRPDQLHFGDTIASYGHCGNSDWMINLVDYHERVGLQPGESYLAQSSAQGFSACALFEGGPGSEPGRPR